MMILVTGGSGSGKSEYAEAAVLSLLPGRRVYIATMRPWDEECHRRIIRHRRQRTGKGFSTVECYGRLEEVRLQGGEAALVECMSNAVSNLMFGALDEKTMITDEFCKKVVNLVVDGILYLKNHTRDLIIVTNEVFSDGGSYPAATLAYQRALAAVNQRLADMADQVVEVAAGIPVVIKDIPQKG